MKQILMIMLLCTSVGVSSCKKFLDVRPDKKLVLPSTVEDLQALLDNYGRMNTSCSSLGEVAADDYYVTKPAWESFPIWDKNAYIWADEMQIKSLPNDWSVVYDVVYIANVVLENAGKITDDLRQERLESIKGSAHFFRAKSFQEAVFTWCKAYDRQSAGTDLGIPLRLNSDFNETSVRVSVQQTYDQIISDLLTAIPLLPIKAEHVMRPSKPAAYALLSRTYLAMGEYIKAGLYADSCLKIVDTLIDYNNLSISSSYPIARFREEDIFHSRMRGLHASLDNHYLKIDTALYNSYDQNDLRKFIFFRNNGDGSVGFKGSYDGSVNLFNGIASDEMYLTRAECLAREGKVAEALTDLNTLLKKRWISGTFIPVATSDAEDALNLILKERRKELLFRNIRWMDLKRLNKEGANITITRVLDNEVFTLAPNDRKYALPLPEDIIDLSEMQQNPY